MGRPLVEQRGLDSVEIELVFLALLRFFELLGFLALFRLFALLRLLALFRFLALLGLFAFLCLFLLLGLGRGDRFGIRIGFGFLRSRLKITGTKKRVAKVATPRPPMTARPSGAFCSPPSPSASDIGSMPRIIASAVMTTGRKRTLPAVSTAPMESLPASICWLAKVTMRIEFAVATPTAIIDPIRLGTLSVVPVR